MNFRTRFALLGLAATLTACGGDEAAAGGEPTAAPVAAEATAAAAPAPTGTVIEVKMVTDGASNYFEPAEVTARPGDVIRYTLVSGVHNVSFPADKNAGLAGLPASSQYLQAPGQTFDVPVDMAPGEYTFQCDPHVMMGMIGTLTVR